MAVWVEWYDKSRHIIGYTFEGNWTSEEFCDAVRQAVQMVEGHAGDMPHTIVDMARTNSVPPDLFSRVAFLRSHTHPNSGLIVLVRTPSIMARVLGLLLPLLPDIQGRVRMVDSLTEAELLISVAQIATGAMDTPKQWDQLVR